MSFPRGNVQVELAALAEEALADAELESLTLYKLLQAFKRVMDRLEEAKRNPVHTIVHTPSSRASQYCGQASTKLRLDFYGCIRYCPKPHPRHCHFPSRSSR